MFRNTLEKASLFHIADRTNTTIFLLKNHRGDVFDARRSTVEDIHITDLGQQKDDLALGTPVDDMKIQPKKLDCFYVHI